MSCPDETTLVAFIEGRLPPAAVAEVDAHLRTCAACGEVVAAAAPAVLAEGSALALAARTRPPPPVAHDEANVLLARGATVGRYVILTLVGRGGMGDVYAAYDPELDRKVALKLLKDVGATNESRARSRSRLLREAKAIAKLSHPNVVVVHDAGTIDDRAFIAMEFVEGQTLNKWLGERARTWSEIRSLFMAAGRGLAAAHAASLVHRDFKPQNVMVTAEGAVKVMDFGLASQHGDEGEGSPPQPISVEHADFARTMTIGMTQTGTVTGTPAYMAPEQFLARPADARTDEFSFCVALYEALHGERPFAGATIGELAQAVTLGKLRDPPARVRVPAWLRKVLLRGLRTSRDERFPTMEALLVALARDPERQRRRVLVGTAVAALLLVGGGFAQRKLAGSEAALCRAGGDRLVGVWELPGADASRQPRRQAVQNTFLTSGARRGEQVWERIAPALDRYAQRWVGMYQEACEATHVRGEQSAEMLDLRMMCLNHNRDSLRALVDVFSSGDPTVVKQAVDAVNVLPDVARCADLSVLRAVMPLPADPDVRRRVESFRQRAAEIRAHAVATGRYKEHSTRIDPMLSEARAVGYQPVVAEVAALGGWLQTALYNPMGARGLYEQALWAAESVRHDEVAAEAAAQLVIVVGFYLNQPQEGGRLASLGEAIINRMGPGHERLRGWLLNNRAVARIPVGQLQEAARDLQDAVALKRKADGGDSPDVALSIYTLGNVHAQQGDYVSALRESTEAIAMLDRAYGPGGSDAARALSNRCEQLNALQRFEEALVSCRDALIGFKEAGLSGVITSYPLTANGVALLGLGRPKEAIDPLRRALEIRELSQEAPETRGETRFALARATWELGDRARARTAAEAARAEYAKAANAQAEVRKLDGWLAGHELGGPRRN